MIGGSSLICLNAYQPRARDAAERQEETKHCETSSRPPPPRATTTDLVSELQAVSIKSTPFAAPSDVCLSVPGVTAVVLIAVMRSCFGAVLSLSVVLGSASAAIIGSRSPSGVSGSSQLVDMAMDKVLLPRAAASGTNLSIIFPAYLYPVGWTTPGAWDPLYTAIAKYPAINFHVIINPNSGPGGNAPNSDYVLAIQKLKKYSNCVLLGYVHTTYGTRSSDDVYSDIAQYAAWTSQNVAMNGIFFDEAPSSAAPALYSYMSNVTTQARASIKNGGQNATIYLNPGTIPDVKYYALADNIAIFEDTYAQFLNNQQKYAYGNNLPMVQSTFLIHSVPGGWNQTQINSLVKALTGNKLGSLYITSVADLSNPYGAFGTYWTQFVAAVDALRLGTA